ncbi:hypothetical protein CYMTET_38395 [Cymbomonas tetramitiformis]|uniref:Calponin-homology (CH) domain-containing protein n=1 Tax=Cymbomonas tetramitiformis TaxID=36881 RepID=A0AAE0F5R2_9CHLO|nr:hypothetical protein CYMTET_38395 [Cymbomonas tetramitiformis]
MEVRSIEQQSLKQADTRNPVKGALAGTVKYRVADDSSTAPLYGLDAELAAKAAAKYDPESEKQAREWITAITGEDLSQACGAEAFAAALKSGVLLCSLLNGIKPGTVKKVNKQKMPFMQMENINSYLEGCKALGMPPSDMFMTVDLYEAKNVAAVVDNVISLARVANSKGFSGAAMACEAAASKPKTGEVAHSGEKHVLSSTGAQRSSAGVAGAEMDSKSPVRTNVSGGIYRKASVSDKAPVYGLDAELAKKAADKYDLQLQGKCVAWLAELAATDLSQVSSADDWQQEMKSGALLCNAINKIKPGSIKKINKMNMPFMQMENITNYLEACKSLGIPVPELFMTIDLFEGKNMLAVMQNVISLGRAAQKVPGYSGPVLDVKNDATYNMFS